MDLHITSDAGSVYLNGARMDRGQVALLLDIWNDEFQFLTRLGDQVGARAIRSKWLDLSLAQPVQWVEDNAVIARLAPLACTVRALDPRIWCAVPFDGEAA